MLSCLVLSSVGLGDILANDDIKLNDQFVNVNVNKKYNESNNDVYIELLLEVLKENVQTATITNLF